jgi:hypothetical protein
VYLLRVEFMRATRGPPGAMLVRSSVGLELVKGERATENKGWGLKREGRRVKEKPKGLWGF